MMKQRKELVLQRQALADSNAAFAAQNQAIEEQIAQQREANRLSVIASSLAAIHQMADADRRAVPVIRRALDRLMTPRRNLPHQSPEFLWHEINQVKDFSELPKWLEDLMTPELAVAITTRRSIAKILREIVPATPEAQENV